MRTTTALSLLLAATTILACDRGEEDTMAQPGQEMPSADQPVVPDEMMLSVSEFEPVGGATTTGAMPIRGTAELRRVTDDGALELHVRVEGLGDEDRAWHIHEGACGSSGPIVVPLSGAQGRDGIASDLDPSNGVADTRVTIDREHIMGLDLTRQYSVNVHQGDGDNPGPPIACANIGGSSTGSPGASGTGTTSPATTTGY